MAQQSAQLNPQSPVASEDAAFRAEHVTEWKSEVTACLNECLEEVQAIGVLLNSLESQGNSGSLPSASTPAPPSPAEPPDPAATPGPAATPSVAATAAPAEPAPSAPAPAVPVAATPTPVTIPLTPVAAPAPEVAPARPITPPLPAIEPLPSFDDAEATPPAEADDDFDARLANLKKMLAERLTDTES